MKFNNFLWTNFLESKEGQKTFEFIRDLAAILRDRMQHERIIEYLNRFKLEKVDGEYIQFLCE